MWMKKASLPKVDPGSCSEALLIQGSIRVRAIAAPGLIGFEAQPVSFLACRLDGQIVIRVENFMAQILTG